MPSPRFGLSVPNDSLTSDVRLLVKLAREAEDAGWDGFFLWDHIVRSPGTTAPHCDPWLALAAIAVSTERLALGPMITPVARRRPWKLAREAVTLDHMSAGRLILGVGLGHFPDFDFFAEPSGSGAKVGRLEEGIEILRLLWTESDVTYSGRHYEIREPVTFEPRPVNGTIPIWGAGRHGNVRPFQRAANYEGVAPIRREWRLDSFMTREELDDVLEIVRKERGNLDDYDVAVQGRTPADPAAAMAVVDELGPDVTWWLEVIHDGIDDLTSIRRRIAAGPPRPA